ncbi:hypothetical protein HZQ11_00035 [Elizabethkingia anophelis]|nr:MULTISPECIES: hypothetical protein [Elizabethkingia]MCT3643667.1 hypothetical protein [Elizabethkingia anophelis]MCT3650081.1 hypothetical protein [Elizabethkingia anophelis]MCT3653688.1 hypothetical protein [Elizabethkingia anophelis]MCT3657921.1 hypothetical protein [Elizabethkingia anophelis]MCT3664805.1 hypothetical protein [Elizabethkingia anophelis]
MKYLRFIVLFIIFIVIVMFLTKKGTGYAIERDKVLQNKIIVNGIVTNIKVSNNHNFGILTLNIVNSNIKEFKSQLSRGIYPYKIQGKVAEIYSYIPAGISKGDKVELNSDEQKCHYYYVKTKEKFEGSIKVITDLTDINFFQENTSLN